MGNDIKASPEEVRYRVHTFGGSWLPNVTGYNLNDYDNWYAGNVNSIDLLEVNYCFVTRKYRVCTINENFYFYQLDNLKVMEWMDLLEIMEKLLIVLN